MVGASYDAGAFLSPTIPTNKHVFTTFDFRLDHLEHNSHVLGLVTHWLDMANDLKGGC